jgi:hypothetical protein
MIRLRPALLALTLIACQHAATGTRSRVKAESVLGRSLRAIDVALAEATRKGLDVESCELAVLEGLDGNLMVGFTSANAAGSTGCPPGPCRCFQVSIDRSTLRVLDSGLSQ